MSDPDDIERIKEVAYEDGRQAGIREVVEWVNANTYWREDAPYKSVLDPADWKPQLKEWGIGATLDKKITA